MKTRIETHWNDTFGPFFLNSLGKDWVDTLYPTLISDNMDELLVKLSRTEDLIPNWEGEGSDLWFNAFKFCPLEDTKVVILGQDPYHTPGAYDGLAFSNSTIEGIQPSLRNILKELHTDIYGIGGEELEFDKFEEWLHEKKDLYPWADQGVLLLNTSQSVVKKNPGVHINEWRFFTEAVIEALQDRGHIVWVLWGKFAQAYIPLIVNPNHHIIKSPHPSPFSAERGFFGSRPFSKTNEYLKSQDIEPINW